jgi:hypothetical protein
MRIGKVRLYIIFAVAATLYAYCVNSTPSAAQTAALPERECGALDQYGRCTGQAAPGGVRDGTDNSSGTNSGSSTIYNGPTSDYQTGPNGSPIYNQPR